MKVSNGLVRSMSPQVPVRLPNLSPDPMTGTNVATMEEIDVDGLSVKRMTLPQKRQVLGQLVDKCANDVTDQLLLEKKNSLLYSI